MSEEEDEEFEIGAIVHRVEFDDLVQKTLNGKAIFNPESIHNGSSKHSKYAYLVHWKGFKLEDRTWEPESNLKKTGQLAAYKAENNFPTGHEKIEKTYGSSVWRNLQLQHDRVKGFRYLMTPKEKLEEKEKKERIEKLKRQDERARAEKIRKMEKNRERMVTPDDPSKLFKKKKKKKTSDSRHGSDDESSKKESFKIPKKKRASSLDRDSPSTSGNPAKRVPDKDREFRKPHPIPSSSSSTSKPSSLDHGDTEKSGAPARPGINPIDYKTPRIQKKTPTYTGPFVTPGYDDDILPPPVFSPPRLLATVTPEPIPDVTLQATASSSSKDGLKITLKKGSDGSYNNIASGDTPRARTISTCSTMSTCSTSEEEEELEDEEVEDQEAIREHEEQVEKARKEMEKLTTELKKFPVEVEVSRVNRSFSEALNMRKLRRCQSAECLSDFYNSQADMEIFGMNYEASSRIPEGEIQAVIKVYPTEEPPILKKKVRVLTEQEEIQMSEELVKENLKRLENVKHPLKKNLMTILPHLVTAYSKDDNLRFKEIFLKNIPKRPDFDAHRYALIVFIISYFNHLKWNADPKGNAIVESDESKMHGNIREHNPLCSHNHRKCTWMRLFMELVPSRMRFVESSEKNYNGRKGDDGPFRDDVYFHCMKRGAECQKRLFFEFDKPIGLQEDDVEDYRVDGMHLLAVQYGNLQRIASYMALGGADINALATHWPTKRVYRLHDYLKFWIDKNVASNSEHMSYYNDLLGMIRYTSESLESFVKGKLNDMIATRMNMMWKIHLDLTYPHIIRCSPINNEENGGDGSHQVLSCLFSPLGVGLREGLPEKEAANEDKDLKKLRKVLVNYQTLVSKQHGRLVLALYRVEIEFAANVENGYVVPTFKHIASNDGFEVEEVNILRQAENLPGEIAHIDLTDHKALTTPGALYYVIKREEQEKNLVVPGNAHIEIIGKFSQPMSFVAQVFYIKRNF